MPHTTTWEKDGIYWKAYGTVTAQEINDAHAQLYSAPRPDRIKYWIWDGAEVDALIISDIRTELVAGYDWAASENNKSIKAAFIATDANILRVIKLYIRISMALESTWEFKIFDNIEDARQWVSC